jgi:hypothetical protein
MKTVTTIGRYFLSLVSFFMTIRYSSLIKAGRGTQPQLFKTLITNGPLCPCGQNLTGFGEREAVASFGTRAFSCPLEFRYPAWRKTRSNCHSF